MRKCVYACAFFVKGYQSLLGCVQFAKGPLRKAAKEYSVIFVVIFDMSYQAIAHMSHIDESIVSSLKQRKQFGIVCCDFGEKALDYIHFYIGYLF